MSSPVRVLGFNERGVPQAPADILARLRAIDPQLGLQCYRWGVEDQWAIVYRWGEHDPRWARVQSGEIDPSTALDILNYLRLDVKPDDVPAMMERSLIAMGAAYGYVDAMLAKVKAANEATKEAVWKPTLDKAQEAIEGNAATLFRNELGAIPKVYQHNPTSKKRKRA